MAALGTFIAGRYTGSYGPPAGRVPVGIAEKGYELQFNWKKELIQDTDAYADTVIDGITRGGEVFTQTILKEYFNGSIAAAFPYSTFTATGNNFLGPPTPGFLDTGFAQSWSLTNPQGTAGAAGSPISLVALYAMVAENFDIRFFFGPTLRKIPLRLRYYPYLDSSDQKIKWFVTT